MKYFLWIFFLGFCGAVSGQDSSYKSFLNSLNTEVPIFYNDGVKSYIEQLESASWSTQKKLNANFYLLKQMETIYKNEGLPKELALMSLSNTGCDQQYVSKEDGSVGVWPLSFSMAKRYNLVINSYVDERKDPIKSSKAAVRFTKELLEIYQDWHFTISSFRAGAIKLNLAIRKANNEINYSKVHPILSGENQKILEKFMAWLYIYHKWQDKIVPDSLPKVDSLTVYEDVDMPLFSHYTGITEAKLKELNPVLKERLIPGSLDSFTLKVPSGEGESVARLIPFLADSTKNAKIVVVQPKVVSATSSTPSGKKLLYYKIKSGDNLGLIADCYDVRVSDIKRWNRLKSSRIIAGKKLKVYVHASKYNSRYKYVNGYSMSKKRQVAARD